MKDGGCENPFIRGEQVVWSGHHLKYKGLVGVVNDVTLYHHGGSPTYTVQWSDGVTRRNKGGGLGYLESIGSASVIPFNGRNQSRSWDTPEWVTIPT